MGPIVDTREASAAPARHFAHQPALDGVRAVSVCLVLAFHAGFGWMSGGYVGVSVFFTLSGYLITSLLLVEWDRSGDIAVGAFFARRLRRLLPASLLCLAFVLLVRMAGGFGSVAGMRADVLGAIGHVFNWLRISGDSSYVQVFDGSAALTSPVEHYWSLAIEEQFYLVWPYVMIALLRRGGRRRMGRILLAAFVVAAAATPLLATRLDADVVYWATPMRLAELLAGAALAALVLHRQLPGWVGRLVAPALMIIVASAIWWPSGSGPAYAGWMGVFAIASVGLIAGLQGETRLAGALSSSWLVGLGRISYGVYLFHWPVFVWLRQQGWDLTSLPRFVIAVALVLTIAGLSHRHVERRVRAKDSPTTPTIRRATVVTAGAFLIVAVLPISRGFLEPDRAVLAAASARAGEDGPVDERPLRQLSEPVSIPSSTALPDRVPASDSVASSRPSPRSIGSLDTGAPALVARTPVESPPGGNEVDVELGPPGARPIRVLVVGDSTAFYVGQALAQWSVDHPGYATVDLATCNGCGFLLDGTVTSWDSSGYRAASIGLLDQRVPVLVDAVHPDVVVLMSTMSDVANRRWNDLEGVLTPHDAAFERRLRDAYEGLTSDLVGAGVSSVVWIKPPVPIWSGAEVEMRETGRWDVMAGAIDGVVDARRRAGVAVLDADGWMHSAGRANDVAFRPDGTHLSEVSARELVDRWLAPRLVDLALDD